MGKIPYLFRRKNVYYFRIRIPIELQEPLQAKAIVRSLKTENRHEATPLALQLAANFAAALYDLKSGRNAQISMSSLIAQVPEQRAITTITFTQPTPIQPKAPLLSVVVADFLERYDPKNKATLTKLKSTLPIFIELVGDKPITNILQADVNHYFDQVQKLPIRHDAKMYRGMSLKKIIATHSGRCIAEGTFRSTYRASVSLLLNWAHVHYKDQGFPSLSVNGAVYRGDRSHGINKQRALTQKTPINSNS